jgi:hypothetical protein
MVYYYDRQNLTDKSIQSSDIEQVQCLQARLIDYYIILWLYYNITDFRSFNFLKNYGFIASKINPV